MTTYFYEAMRLGQDNGVTFWWSQPPKQIGPLMHSQGPNLVVHDDRGNWYTGDEFWDDAGMLRWAVRS
jgi:hypothetical protein